MRDPKASEQDTPSNSTDCLSNFSLGPGIADSGAGAVVLSHHQIAVLERVIENSIVPRLLLGSRTAFAGSAAEIDPSRKVTPEHVGEFAELIVQRDASESVEYFEALRIRGASIEVLFQDLLAPVARRLGELWNEDINDFLDVTRGVGHLQQIVNDYSDAFHSEARCPVSNRRALLMPIPGEMHSLGISLVGEHYRRAGWHVWGGPPRNIDEILELVAGQWFDVVGLSVSRLPNASTVARDISRIRKSSMNKEVIIQIGGNVFSQNPDLVSAVGADATATNGRQAVLQITGMIAPSNFEIR